MCESKWLAIFLIVLLIFVFLFKSQKSNFQFNNADYEYSNPSAIEEHGYYSCVFRECGGDADNYDCLERCKFSQFHLPQNSDIRDKICDFLPEDERWNCLNDFYRKYGYNV